MPTTPTTTYSNLKLEPVYDADLARQRAVAIAPSQTIARGTILGELTASPGTYAPYASSNTDGTEVAKAICAYDIVTDSAGHVTLSATSGASPSPYGAGLAGKSAPVYVSGVFASVELTGLDSGAVTDLGARFEQGTLAGGGILHIA